MEQQVLRRGRAHGQIWLESREVATGVGGTWWERSELKRKTENKVCLENFIIKPNSLIANKNLIIKN